MPAKHTSAPIHMILTSIQYTQYIQYIQYIYIYEMDFTPRPSGPRNLPSRHTHACTLVHMVYIVYHPLYSFIPYYMYLQYYCFTPYTIHHIVIHIIHCIQ
jgi:hypothetical protein